MSAAHTTRFDQAGMMLRADERNRLKTGLEVTSGVVQISTVLRSASSGSAPRSPATTSSDPGGHRAWVSAQSRTSSAICSQPRCAGSRCAYPSYCRRSVTVADL